MIVGMTGVAGSGKDTVARYLAEHYGFAVVSFAMPLYLAVSAITDMCLDDLYDREIKEATIPWLGKSPRELLQSLGTDWGRRMVSEDIWIKIAMHRAKEIADEGGNVVIPDVRFDNEAMAVRLAGGENWLVERPGVHSCVGATADHESEKGISKILVDSTLLNDSSIEALRAQADRSLVQYKE